MGIVAMKVLLLSGGLDSTALAWWQKPGITITIDYGQRAATGEIRAATAIAGALGLEHHVLKIDAAELGGGVMAGGERLREDLPPEWWPFRNQFLITVAAMRFANIQNGEILIGTVKGDSAHCDGTREFIEALDSAFRLQVPHFRIRAPAIHLTAAELLAKAAVPDAILGWTFSCHVADVACGECRGCLKHIEARGLKC